MDLHLYIDDLTSDSYDEICEITDDRGLTEHIIEIMNMSDDLLKIEMRIRDNLPRKILLLKYISYRSSSIYTEYLRTINDDLLISIINSTRSHNFEVKELAGRSLSNGKMYDVNSDKYLIDLIECSINRSSDEILKLVLTYINDVSFNQVILVIPLLAIYSNSVILTQWVFNQEHLNRSRVINIILDTINSGVIIESRLVKVYTNLLKYINADDIAESIINSIHNENMFRILIKVHPNLDYVHLLEISKSNYNNLKITNLILEVLSQV